MQILLLILILLAMPLEDLQASSGKCDPIFSNSKTLAASIEPQQISIVERAALGRVLRIIKDGEFVIEKTYGIEIPIHYGKRIIKNGLTQTKMNFLGNGAMGFVHRIEEAFSENVIVEKSYFRIDTEAYGDLSIYQMAQQESLALNWIDKFLVRNQIQSINVPKVLRVKEVGRFKQPSVELENIWGTSLYELMINESIAIELKKTLAVKYAKALLDIFVALKIELQNGKFKGSTDLYVDEYAEVEGFGFGLPSLIIRLENVKGSLLDQQELTLGFVRSNIVVNTNGELYLVDPF